MLILDISYFVLWISLDENKLPHLRLFNVILIVLLLVH